MGYWQMSGIQSLLKQSETSLALILHVSRHVRVYNWNDILGHARNI